MFRLWLFIAGLSGAAAVLAGAYGSHALFPVGTVSVEADTFHVGQLYHLVHSIALAGVAALMAATDGRRRLWAAALLNAAALAFVTGILCFAGGIYVHILTEVPPGRIVPAGGIAFTIGWVALTLSVAGFRGVKAQS
jgi:uncharacterized membrane protein YgdD (TMEM256/DUF423 family)